MLCSAAWSHMADVLTYRHCTRIPFCILIRGYDLCELIPGNELNDNNKEDVKVDAGEWTVM